MFFYGYSLFSDKSLKCYSENSMNLVFKAISVDTKVINVLHLYHTRCNFANELGPYLVSQFWKACKKSVLLSAITAFASFSKYLLLS